MKPLQGLLTALFLLGSTHPLHAQNPAGDGGTGDLPGLIILIAVGGAVLFLFSLHRKASQTREIYRELLDQASQGTVLLSIGGKVLFWNRQMEIWTGLPAAAVLEKGLSEIPPFSSDHPVVRMFSGVLTHPYEHPLVFRTQMNIGNGKERPIIATLRRFPAINQDEFMVYLSIEDISESEELRERLQHALREADQNVQQMTEVDKVKSEFLAICGHELKTPLVSISGYLDLIFSEKFGPLTDRQRNAVEISLRNASRLNELLQSLLDFARMEAGKMRFEFTPQRLQSMLEEVIQVVHPMFHAKNLTLKQEIDPSLPLVYMDGNLINRVFFNLFDNAIKFTPPGGMIVLKAFSKGDFVYAQICDTGTGIDPQKIPRVTQAFYQADASDTRRKGGLGLGLAIVEKILSGHGSQLEIESEPGKGTTMRFRLKIVHKKSSGKFEAFIPPSPETQTKS